MIISVFTLVLGGSREPLPYIGHVHGSLCQPINIYLRVHDNTYIYMQSLKRTESHLSLQPSFPAPPQFRYQSLHNICGDTLIRSS